MLTTPLGTSDWFVWDLRQSNLIDLALLDPLIEEFLSRRPEAAPCALAEHLVNRGLLTRFQADRLLEGHTNGFVLGQFTLLEVLGAGSMGAVYKAQSRLDNRFYAVKILPRRSIWQVHLARRKVRLFAQCRHPAVVPFVDVGAAGGVHYLAWPFVEGKTLEQIVHDQGKFSPEQTAAFGVEAAEGLELCHQQGLFHGLLKPSNLTLRSDGQLRLLDFGIGCLLAQGENESLMDTMSTANSITSGLDCASPESILNPTNLTALGDQYSLGCVIYFCLTGRYPFAEGSTVEKVMGHQFREPTPIKELIPNIPDGLAAVVEKLMKKAPADRYASAGAAAEALRPFATLAQRAASGPGSAQASDPMPPSEPAASPDAEPTIPLALPVAAIPGRGWDGYLSYFLVALCALFAAWLMSSLIVS